MPRLQPRHVDSELLPFGKVERVAPTALFGRAPLDRGGSDWDVRFKLMDDEYFAKYSAGTPRQLADVQPRNISLDFEVETLRWLRTTPDLVLTRGGIKAMSFESNYSEVSVGIDGTGCCGLDYHQRLSALYELETSTMSPQSFVNASFLRYMDNKMTKKKDFTTNEVLQFTVGLPIDVIPTLFFMANYSKSPRTHETIISTEKFCARRPRGCEASYKGLLVLATTVLAEARHCSRKGACPNPKRCQEPWLVRTNFGDMVTYLQRLLGNESMLAFPDDVLSIWGGDADKAIYPNGFKDYLHFPEMAEIGGFVQSRLGKRDRSKPRMPRSRTGLFKLARRMMHRRKTLERTIKHRKCGVWGLDPGKEAMLLTPRKWLQAMLSGQDLMSDEHSPLSQASFSHTVWKSMGNWRMQPQDPGRVYVECRAPTLCIDTVPTRGRFTVSEAMGAVATKMVELERSI